jgi:HAD superfamily hydrolase (TIGR01509 family)
MFRKRLPAAVLFDLDGTLIDSEPYWMKSERDLAEAHASEWTEEDGQKLIGLNLYDSSKLIKAQIGSELEPQEIIDKLTEGVNQQLARAVPWRPGAEKLLRELRRKRVKTALVTMSMRRTALQVVETIPFKAFDVIVAGDDVVHGKPHAEPYLKAAELLGVNPEDCVAIEDSITGILSAEAARTKAVGIPNLMIIPQREGRILWQTLEGVNLKQLKQLFKEGS